MLQRVVTGRTEVSMRGCECEGKEVEHRDGHAQI